MQYYLILRLFMDQVVTKLQNLRAFSMRFMGDDVRYIDRVGSTSPPFEGINLRSGDMMREDWFPKIFIKN